MSWNETSRYASDLQRPQATPPPLSVMGNAAEAGGRKHVVETRTRQVMNGHAAGGTDGTSGMGGTNGTSGTRAVDARAGGREEEEDVALLSPPPPPRPNRVYSEEIAVPPLVFPKMKGVDDDDEDDVVEEDGEEEEEDGDAGLVGDIAQTREPRGPETDLVDHRVDRSGKNRGAARDGRVKLRQMSMDAQPVSTSTVADKSVTSPSRKRASPMYEEVPRLATTWVSNSSVRLLG